MSHSGLVLRRGIWRFVRDLVLMTIFCASILALCLFITAWDWRPSYISIIVLAGPFSGATCALTMLWIRWRNRHRLFSSSDA
jgi:hypothetical protein